MIVDKIWKLTNAVRVGLAHRSSNSQKQVFFPDNVCSYCPPCHGVSHYENLTPFCFPWIFFRMMQVGNLWVRSLSPRVENVWRSENSTMGTCISTTSMDFDPSSLEGEAQLQAYMQVQQESNDTDPLMWWKQHQQEFPDFTQMARQYLTVPATSASPERFFSRVGLVQTDLRRSLLDTTMIDLMWVKQAP